MKAVTSNAVATALGNRRIKLITGLYEVNLGYITVRPNMPDANYVAFVQGNYTSGSTNLDLIFTVQCYTGNAIYVYPRKGDGSIPSDGTQILLSVLIIY